MMITKKSDMYFIFKEVFYNGDDVKVVRTGI